MTNNVAIKLAAAFVRQGLDCMDRGCHECPFYSTIGAKSYCLSSFVVQTLKQSEETPDDKCCDFTVARFRDALSQCIERLMLEGNEVER